MAKTRLVVSTVRKTKVPELSAVAIASGRIYVADDEHGVAELGPRGASFGKNGEIEGVEGLTASGDGRSLYAVSENSRRLYRLPLGRDGAIGRADDLGKLPRAGDTKKKGWDELDDLSDVAIEPSTGLVWLLSDESSAIGIAALVKGKRGVALESREVVKLPVDDAQSEGITFDEKGGGPGRRAGLDRSQGMRAQR